MGPSRILIIGATSAIGKHVANASVKLGHRTFALVRTTTPSDSAKAELLKSFQDAGITLLVGDLNDHASLVAALKQVDVLISAVGPEQIQDQIKLLPAMKDAGTIKRFFPSEFGNDVDRMEFDIPLSKPMFEEKQKLRRAIEKSGIPYTYIAAGAFASYYLTPIVQASWTPPREGTKLLIFGDGNAKANFVDEVDIGTFTIKAVDDPRTENKILHICPKENVASQNDVTAIWERKIGHTFEKEILDKAGVIKSTGELPTPYNFHRAVKYSIFVKGDQTGFALDPSKDIEATELYPDVKYTTIDEYLTPLV